MGRCERRSFWAAGVKVYSGEATAWTALGPLKVVCRRAKPGEINVQELPDGTPLDVPSIGFLTFDAKHWRGKAGRSIKPSLVIETLNHVPAMMFKQRALNTRDDRELIDLAIRNARVQWVPKRAFQAAVRRNRHLWSHIVAATQDNDNYAAQLAIEVIDDPVLLYHVMNAPFQDSYSGYTLNRAAAMRLAELGHHRDVGAFLHSIKEVGEKRARVHDMCETMARFPMGYLEEFTLELLSDPEWVALVPTVFLYIVRHHQLDQSQQHELATLAVRLIEQFDIPPEPSSPYRLSPESSLDQLRREARYTRPTPPITAEELDSMADEEVLAEFLGDLSNSSRLLRLMELAKRDLPNAPYQSQPDFRWMKIMLRAGLQDSEVLTGFYHPNVRAKAVDALSERDLRWVVEDGSTPAATFAALKRLGDDAAWIKFAATMKSETDLRWALEHISVSALNVMISRPTSSSRAEVIREVATYRGVVSPQDAFTSASAKVRRAAVRKTKDAAIIDAAVLDPSPEVATTAARATRSIKALDDRLSNLGDSDEDTQLAAALKRRRDQLVALELVQHSMARGEVVVARAGIDLIHDRVLLLELTRYQELAPYLAEKLQRITLRTRRRK
jgi:hypothetical protein